MLSKDGKLKKIAAIVTICSFIMTFGTNAAWASSPAGDEAMIMNFAQRLDALIPDYGDGPISGDQLLAIYSKAEMLKSDLAAAAAEVLLQNDASECKFIRLTALVWLMLGTETILSLLSTYLQITIAPPETTVGTIRAYMRIAKKIITTVAIAPVALANSVLAQLQYWQCKNEMGQ
jgi:hypothetical protein